MSTLTLEEGLVEYLMAQSSVTDLISDRLYPLVVPQDASLPAAAYQIISAPRDYALDGATGAVEMRLQLTYLATTYAAAQELAEVVRQEISGFRGWWSTVRIDFCRLENAYDTWGDQFEKPVVRQDYRINYQE